MSWRDKATSVSLFLGDISPMAYPLPRFSSQKVIIIRPDGRTDGRTSDFLVPRMEKALRAISVSYEFSCCFLRKMLKLSPLRDETGVKNGVKHDFRLRGEKC